MTTGIRRDQWRGLEQRPITGDDIVDGTIVPADLNASVYGGAPAAIDPDDAGAAGVALTVSRSDHQHQFTTAAPGSIAPDDTATEGVAATMARSDHRHGYTTAVAAALTKTATASEGVAATSARSDHVHATSALPWGIMAYQELTGTSSAYSSAADPGTTTDFALASVAVDVTRLYRVHLHTQFILVTTANWLVNFVVGGSRVGRFHAYNTATAQPSMINASLLWLPSSGTVNLDVRVADNSGAGGTIQFQAAAGNNNRQFWVEDIGPR